VTARFSEWWFPPNWRNWHPRLFEYYFTLTRVGIRTRAEETALVSSALEESLRPHHRVADVGAGTGHYTALLAARCANVLAVDASPEMLGYLRRRLAKSRFDNVVVRAARLPDPLALDAPVDGVVCVGVLQYIEDLGAALQVLAGAVVSGGWLVFTVTPQTREAQRYAGQERRTRRRIYLRTDEDLLIAAAGAGLEVRSLATAACVTRVACCSKSVPESPRAQSGRPRIDSRG